MLPKQSKEMMTYFCCCGPKAVKLNVFGMTLYNLSAPKAQLQLFQQIFRERQSSLEVNFLQTHLRGAHGVNLAADLYKDYSLVHFAHHQEMTFNNFKSKQTNYCPHPPCTFVPWQILNWLHLQIQKDRITPLGHTQEDRCKQECSSLSLSLSQRTLNSDSDKNRMTFS